MSSFSDYAIVYDITSDRERARADKILKSFGFRVQKSVFECRMTKRQKEELVRRMESLGIKTGFVKIYRLEYTLRHTVIGTARENIDDGNAFVI